MILSPGGTMYKPPCQKCDTRKVGCHDSCPQYQEYKAKATEVNTAVREARNELSKQATEAYKGRRHLYGF